jgi:hypothetical protein
MNHKMMVLYKDNDCHILKCDTCSRKVVFILGLNGKIVYIDKGDPDASHSYGTGGMGGLSANASDGFDPFNPETYKP